MVLNRILIILCFSILLFSIECATAENAVPITVDRDNATWAVYNATNNVTCISASPDGSTLWVGTSGGLQGLGMQTYVYTSLNGLPSNRVESLSQDDCGGLWVGTNKGLAHLFSDGTWQVFTIDNCELPDNEITSLSHDDEKGLWIGTNSGLGHRRSDASWEIINTTNSGLPSNSITALLNSTDIKLWIGTTVGMAVLRNDGEQQVID